MKKFIAFIAIAVMVNVGIFAFDKADYELKQDAFTGDFEIYITIQDDDSDGIFAASFLGGKTFFTFFEEYAFFGSKGENVDAIYMFEGYDSVKTSFAVVSRSMVFVSDENDMKIFDVLPLECERLVVRIYKRDGGFKEYSYDLIDFQRVMNELSVE